MIDVVERIDEMIEQLRDLREKKEQAEGVVDQCEIGIQRTIGAVAMLREMQEDVDQGGALEANVNGAKPVKAKTPVKVN